MSQRAPSHQPGPATSLSSDSCGAVMIMAVFMAIIAIGALYFLVGLGDALLAQERMQDAADATAFSSAVIHARGMNILALINIIMASVLAVLVLLAILGSILATGAKAVAIAAFFIPPAAAAASALNSAGQTVKAAEKAARPTVETVLKIGHGLQGPLTRAIPMIAGLNAHTLSSQSYGPVVSAGITFPILERLPTVDGTFDTLCTKAGKYAGSMAAFPITTLLKPFPAADFVGDKLESLARSAGVAYAKFYCGGGKMPKVPSISVKVSLPELNCDERTTCESDSPGDSCEKYAKLQQEVAAAYNVESASCESTDPQIQNYCEQIRRRARTECQPGNGATSTTWVTQEAEHFYRIEREGDTKRVVKDIRDASDGTKRPDGIERRDGKEHTAKNLGGSPVPCHRTKLAGFDPDYKYSKWNVDPGEPLCTEKFDPPTASDFGDRETMTITVTEVADIVMCESKKKLKSKLSGKPIEENLKKNTPQEMCNCAALGEEMFQIRSVVFGDAEEYTAESDGRILVATLGEEAPSTTLGQIASVAGRLAAAQAEYYFESDDRKVQDNPSEWLWHMNWKARMRRLSFSRKAWECPEEKNTCERKSGTLGKLTAKQGERISGFTAKLKEGADAVIVH